MKLGHCAVLNFGSYAELDFDFTDLGLSLIYGKTGSGKSTLPDLPAWCLYGITAKDGSADDVKSWNASGPTRVDLEVELYDGDKITVTRIRGKQNENDLYWIEETSPEVLHRGKDLSDTQKRLESRLGVSREDYLSSCYFHEFSAAGNFFTAKAKDRREVFEKIADLQLPARLAKETVEAKKQAKAEVTKHKSDADRLTGELTSLQRSIADAAKRSADWALEQMTKLDTLAAHGASFEQDKSAAIAELKALQSQHFKTQDAKIKTQIAHLEKLNAQLDITDDIGGHITRLTDDITRLEAEKCGACGGPKSQDSCAVLRKKLDAYKTQKRDRERLEDHLDNAIAELERIDVASDPFAERIKAEADRPNTFAAQADAIGKASNPFLAQIEQMQGREVDAEEDLHKADSALNVAELRLSALEQLYDLSSSLRGELLRKAVKDIQDNCNRILETYFDGEFRLEFNLTGADSLDVGIQKSGNECVYKQLSKGQRQLLKLSFVTSIMKANANRIGAHFGSVFLDEPTDGLDSELKVKAFGLLSELEAEHSTVLVIEHSPDLQAQFSRRYHVAMSSDDCSVITHEE